MHLLIIFKALIIGALFGGLIMFISAFTGKPKVATAGHSSFADKALTLIRFFCKLVLFFLALALPLFLIKIIA